MKAESRQDYYAPFARWPIADDELMTLVGTHSLVNLYANSPREVEQVAPSDLGVHRFGHSGPFRSEHEARLWLRMSTWLSALAKCPWSAA